MGLRTISPKEAFELFHQKDGKGDYKPFSITFFSANIEKGTGGERKTIHRGRTRRITKHSGRKKFLICVQDIDSDTHPVTIHVPLIDEVNGRKMTF